MSETPDFTEEARAIHGALAAAYRRGCSDTIARLMAGAAVANIAAQPAPKAVVMPEGYFPPRAWTEAEDDLLRREWGKSPCDEIGAVVNRTGAAIRLRAAKIGLPRLPRFSFLRERKS